jgi:hypothetical protein
MIRRGWRIPPQCDSCPKPLYERELEQKEILLNSIVEGDFIKEIKGIHEILEKISSLQGQLVYLQNKINEQANTATQPAHKSHYVASYKKKPQKDPTSVIKRYGYENE